MCLQSQVLGHWAGLSCGSLRRWTKYNIDTEHWQVMMGALKTNNVGKGIDSLRWGGV